MPPTTSGPDLRAWGQEDGTCITSLLAGKVGFVKSQHFRAKRGVKFPEFKNFHRFPRNHEDLSNPPSISLEISRARGVRISGSPSVISTVCSK